jgi:hypothetical protein
MPPKPQGDIPHIRPSQIENGDLVIRRAALEQHTGLDTGSLITKLGELGLPPAAVAKLKTGKETVKLLAYDPETQPPLGKHPWSDFEAFLEAGNLEPPQQGRLRAKLADIHNHGTGRDGGMIVTQTRAPVLYSKSSGEPLHYAYLPSMQQDMDDVLIDVGVLESYLRHNDLICFSGIGPASTAEFTEFMNTKIAALPEA